MRYFFSICLWAAAIVLLKGQSTEISLSGDLSTAMNQFFEHVNFSEASTGFLFDRALKIQNLQHFNGQDTSSENRADFSIFGGAYATLYSSNFDGSKQLPGPEIYMNAAQQVNPKSDTLPMTILAWKYNYIDSNAINNNLFTIQGDQLYDVPNRPESPYLLGTAFVASFLEERNNTGSVFVSFPPELQFNNLASPFQSFVINVGNGEQFALPGDIIQVVFPENGPNRVYVKATLVDGSVLHGHCALNVTTSIGSKFDNNPDYSSSVTTSDGTRIFISIFYNNTTCGEEDECPKSIPQGPPCKLIRPLIVIDGFDTDDSRTYSNLLNRIKIEPFGQTDPTLEDFIEQGGYDLIFLDYANGSEDIRKNGLAVAEAIKQINEWKNASGSFEKNVIIGASMGGLTGKYAILKMEEEGHDYQTSKFFNLDSPMYGANFPVGFQAAVYHALNLKIFGLIKLSAFIKKLDKTEVLLERPALKQQLIYKIPDGSGSLKDAEHVSFMNEFHSMGLTGDGRIYNCEYIVLCSGALGTQGQQKVDQTFAKAGDKILSVHGDLIGMGGIAVLDEISDLEAFLISAMAMLYRTNLVVFMDIWSVPNNSSKKVYDCDIFARVLGINIIASSMRANVSGTDPVDTAPGGNMSLGILSQYANNWPLSNLLSVYFSSFCFVPTISALDIDPPANLTGDYSNISALVSSGSTPIDRYIGMTDANNPLDGYSFGTFNTSHALINDDIARYLISEIMGSEELNDPGLLTLDGRTYNFGDSRMGYTDSGNNLSSFTVTKTGNRISHDLTVEGTGKIWVNRNDKIAFTDVVSNLDNSTNSAFHVYLSGTNCATSTTSTVTVKNGGEITVGEWNATTNNIGLLHVGRNATLNIERNGTVDVSDRARLFSENGGTTNVTNGGLLHVNWWEGKIVVRKGGVLRVHSGGMLRVSNGAAVEVEDGGTLIIEPQAKIQLWGGVVQGDGESRIHIKQGGELVINGEFDFSHDGYFRFDDGYSLTLGSGTFKLKGAGKDTRFIQMNNSDLVISGNQTLDFKDGKVQYIGATITAQEGGKIVFNHVKCVGSGKALYLNDPNLISIIHTDIVEGFNPAIEAWNVRNNIPFNVSNCNIEVGTTNGVEAYYCQMLRFANTNFIEPTPADQSTGIWLKSVQMLSLTNCNLSNMWKGIDAIDSKVVRMSGGEIADCDIGINDDYSIVYGGTPVHVMMFDGATIRNSLDKAIYILGGKSAGSVLMDCAKLIDNANGIVGEDITLMVDAEENRQCITDPVSPNTFKRQANQGPFFSICYNQKDIGQVEAKANYWFPHNPGDWKPIPGSWMLHKVLQGGNGQCTDFVGFNSNLAVQNEPPGCTYPTFPCQHGEPPAPLAECEILLENEPFIVQEEFHSGINAIKGENLELGETLLTPVSELKGELGNALNGVCKNLVEMAYAIIETEVESRPSVRWRAGRNDRGLDDAVSIAPNPAANFVQLGCSGQFLIHVVDGLGSVVWDESAEDFVVLNTRSWPTGVYIIRVQAAGKQVQKTLVIQR